MRDVYPIKYYKDEGFVEYKVEIGDEDLADIIEAYLIFPQQVEVVYGQARQELW